VEPWFAEHPKIEIVSRDRGGGYGEAVTEALPHAVQVADRWHLMENSSAFLDAVRKSTQSIRVAIGATKIDPDLVVRRSCNMRLPATRGDERPDYDAGRRRHSHQGDRAPHRP
jgi:transposase